MISKSKSIYYQILEAKELGKNGNFQIVIKDKKKQTPFIPGALDGVIIFNKGIKEQQIDLGLSKILFEKNSIKNKIKKLEKYFKKNNNFNINNITNLIAKEKEYTELDQDKKVEMIKLAVELITNGTTVQSVKLGISLLEIFNINKTPQFIEGLKVLGEYDEFTYYIAKLLSNSLSKEDLNDLLFNYAKNSKGWGRISALENIKESTQEIQDWVLFSASQEEQELSLYQNVLYYNLAEITIRLINNNVVEKELLAISKIINNLITDKTIAILLNEKDFVLALQKYLDFLQKYNMVETQKDKLTKLLNIIEEDAVENSILIDKLKELV